MSFKYKTLYYNYKRIGNVIYRKPLGFFSFLHRWKMLDERKDEWDAILELQKHLDADRGIVKSSPRKIHNPVKSFVDYNGQNIIYK